jgi:hypothetical protein
MDHLKTIQERQGRWYSRSKRPRHIPIFPALNFMEVVDANPEDKTVKSIPFKWLSNPPDGFDLKAALQIHGFLVVSNVLDQEECPQALHLAWDWLKAAATVEQWRNETEESNLNLLQDIYESSSPESILASEHFPRSVEGGKSYFFQKLFS